MYFLKESWGFFLVFWFGLLDLIYFFFLVGFLFYLLIYLICFKMF